MLQGPTLDFNMHASVGKEIETPKGVSTLNENSSLLANRFEAGFCQPGLVWLN